MNSRKSPDFNECFAALPADVQQKARETFKSFQKDPTYPGLKFKKIKGMDDMWSIRITGDYRALGVKEGDTIVWFFIGGHADYDKIVS